MTTVYSHERDPDTWRMDQSFDLAASLAWESRRSPSTGDRVVLFEADATPDEGIANALDDPGLTHAINPASVRRVAATWTGDQWERVA